MYRMAMENLLAWKQSRRRKPLIIEGARQVGKTWLMKEFGRLYYTDTVYINFDSNSRMAELFASDLDTERLIMGLELYSGQKIDPDHTLLIFDEVITGFRLSKAGAQEYFGIQSDLTTYGKIIGGGMPVGAYGGRKEVMEVVSPVGNVYQAGTLSGNPVAMAAGLAQLHYLNEHPEVYTHLNALGEKLYGGMEKMCEELQLPYQVNHVGSLGSLFFTDQPVVDYTSAKTSDTKKFAEYFRYMLGNGVYIASSQFEAMFISDAHTDEEIQHTLNIMHNYFEK